MGRNLWNGASMQMSKLMTIGLGYIGLPTALSFAKSGEEVVGVDISSEIVSQLNQGIVHLEEPGVAELLAEVLADGTFRASTTPEQADVFIISVPTPNQNDKYHSCDFQYVDQAVQSILPFLQKGNTVIIESTIPPKTTVNRIQPMIESYDFVVGEDIYLAHCPERVLPGKILCELRKNNRIIGGVTKRCAEKGKEIYDKFVEGELILAGASEAELSKLMENTYRDINIAIANELVKVGDDLEIDVLKVIEMANKHPRVHIHQPGPGVGGHCLAVDPYFVVAASPENTELIQTARAINSNMPTFIVRKTKQLMDNICGKKITIFGLAYKGNIDDIRESPAIEVLRLLKETTNYEISVYDPHVQIDQLTQNKSDALRNSDLVLILTDHAEFKQITEADFSHMKQRYLLDTKQVYEHSNSSVHYYSLGDISRIKQEKLSV